MQPSPEISLQDRVVNLWHQVRWYASQMWHQFFERDCLNAAAALTYTTLFAVVPMMAVTYTFFSLIPEYAQMGEQVQSFVFQNFVPGSSDVIQEKLEEFADRARNLTSIGFVMLFATTFMMLVTIEKTFNSIWHVAEPRRGLQRFLLYWGVLSLGPASLVVGLLTTVYLVSLPLVSEMDTFGVVQLLLGYLPLLLTLAGFTVLYCAVPNCYVPIKHGLAGGLVATIIFQSAFGLFAETSRSFTYDAIYGAFAAIPIFLLWLYLVWVIVLCGAIFVRSLALPREDQESAEPLLIKTARVLQLFHQAHLAGEVVTDKQINNLVTLNRVEHERMFDVLKTYKLLNQTEDEHWVLGRSLKAITLWDLYQHLPDGLELERLKRIQDMPRVVDPLLAITQFGSNEMSVSLDSVFTS
ncbi:MAG: YihY family inner membrane protein [Pseudomonadota bacterium]